MGASSHLAGQRYGDGDAPAARLYVASAASTESVQAEGVETARGAVSPRPSSASTPFTFACPACRGPVSATSNQARCGACGAIYPRVDGVWDFLPPARAAAFATFLREYETVRIAEGWGSADAAYYLSLPDTRPADPQWQIWRQRARGYRTFRDRVLDGIATSRRPPLNVLDLGAGNGWLAHRLAALGNDAAAVDLSTNPTDGLGAPARYGAHPFLLLRAEFDRLPLADGQADLAIFNAALHYSADVAATLREALRVLRPDGQIVVFDSPVYRDARSGARMIQERDEGFRHDLGISRDGNSSEGFLTWQRLDSLARDVGLEWQVVWPVPAWRRSLRRARAWVRGEREAAEFPVLVGQLPQPDLVPSRSARQDGTAPSPAALTPFPGGEGGGEGEPDCVASARDYPQPVAESANPPHPNPLPRGEGTSERPPSRNIASIVWQSAAPPFQTSVGRFLVRWRFRLFQRQRFGRAVLEQIGPWSIVVLPDVFNPRLFRTGEFLALTLDAHLVPSGAKVLDLGTGSGIGAIAASRWARQVVAVDLNPEAVRCARINAQLNHVDDRIDVREGDLFAPVGNERFDLVLFNPPFFRGEPRSRFDLAWRSPDVVQRFAMALSVHLTPTGSALVVLSSDGDATAFLNTFERSALTVDVVGRRHFLNETLTVYGLTPCPSPPAVERGATERGGASAAVPSSSEAGEGARG